MFSDSPFLPTFPRLTFGPPPIAPRVPEIAPPYHPVVRPRPQEPRRTRPSWPVPQPTPNVPATEPEFEPEAVPA